MNDLDTDSMMADELDHKGSELWEKGVRGVLGDTEFERLYPQAVTHKFPIGALVEFNHGPRLWVVHHVPDHDPPLYCLSFNPCDTKIERVGFYNDSWVKGVPEYMLAFIRMVNAPDNKD